MAITISYDGYPTALTVLFGMAFEYGSILKTKAWAAYVCCIKPIIIIECWPQNLPHTHIQTHSPNHSITTNATHHSHMTIYVSLKPNQESREDG